MYVQHLAIEKLEDAHLAGTHRSHECTLIVTEGDSAKALAVAGLEALGRYCLVSTYFYESKFIDPFSYAFVFCYPLIN